MLSSHRQTEHKVDKMHALLLIVLHAVLCWATPDSQEHNTDVLMDNVLVLRVPHERGSWNVLLTCGEAYQNQAVFWKKNGMDLDPALEGNQVRVLVEEMDGGNYTCHLSANGQYLNHTLILIQLDADNRTVILEEKSPEDGHIHCSAPNYKGSFHCTWKRTQTRSNAAVLLVKAEREFEKIPCVLDADGSGVRCEDAHCPFKEEQNRISLTVYIHSYSRLEAHAKAFYLRDIVMPAKIPDLGISDGNVFSWKYPENWEEPVSFFSLQFQVKVVHDKHTCNSKEFIMLNTTEETKYMVNVKTKKYVFCVRAQDKHTGGPWSHWSQYIVGKHNTKLFSRRQ